MHPNSDVQFICRSKLPWRRAKFTCHVTQPSRFRGERNYVRREGGLRIFAISSPRPRHCVTCPGFQSRTGGSHAIALAAPELFAWPCKTALMGVFPDPGTSNETRTYSKGFVGRRTSRLGFARGYISARARTHASAFIHLDTRRAQPISCRIRRARARTTMHQAEGSGNRCQGQISDFPPRFQLDGMTGD